MGRGIKATKVAVVTRTPRAYPRPVWGSWMADRPPHVNSLGEAWVFNRLSLRTHSWFQPLPHKPVSSIAYQLDRLGYGKRRSLVRSSPLFQPPPWAAPVPPKGFKIYE